jgi:hypothetical protein
MSARMADIAASGRALIGSAGEAERFIQGGRTPSDHERDLT